MQVSEKKFDQFLSHKISDAKDVVLTWYNALSALGHNPFLDRLSLDAVENIPKYVEQSVTVVIAVTSHLWQSYWCAVELCHAVQHHADGILNIVLVPVQGERWTEVEGENEGAALSFPTPSVMMQNFDKWFPEGNTAATPRARALVTRLYGGGEYTKSRLVPHTLMHYKSFERLLVARLGISISGRRRMEQIIAAGGGSVAEQYAALLPVVNEANAMQRLAFGSSASHFEVEVTYHRGAMGYADVSTAELQITEHDAMSADADADADSESKARTIEINQFMNHVIWLRGRCVSKRYHSASVLVEQLMLAEALELQPSSADLGGDGEVWEAVSNALGEAAEDVGEAFKVVSSFLQVNGSFLTTFGGIRWPRAFREIAGVFNGMFSFDWLNAEVVGDTVSSLNYCDVRLRIPNPEPLRTTFV